MKKNKKPVGRPEQRFKIHTSFDNAIKITMKKKIENKKQDKNSK